jgi:hypothetical protein
LALARSLPGHRAVMWNEPCMQLVRERQELVIRPFIEALPPEARGLEIGCGIGIVAPMITCVRDDIKAGAVDFEEMVQVALAATNREFRVCLRAQTNA